MAKARRARRRPARVVVPIIVVVVVLAAVAVVWQARSGAPTAAPDDTRPSSSNTAPSPDAPVGSASPAASASASASAPVVTSASAAEALEGCRARVAAGDDVVQAAEQGVEHWSEHVQAQTDHDSGTISTAVMTRIFTRTRLAGSDDMSRYEDATQARDDAEGSCATREDASTADNSQFAFCGQRLEAQDPVLDAGRDGMTDWKSHLAAMKRSRTVHVDNAEQIWIDAWKAAPPHLEAFAEAAKTYEDAPDC